MAFSGLNLDDVAEFAPESFAYPAAARIDDGPASDKEDALADLADNEDEDLWQDDGQGSHMHVLSPLDMLASCFPDVDSRKLSTVLAGNNFSLSRTMDELFGVGAQSGKPKKAVCRHLLAGHCARSDCLFSHAMDDFICRFNLSPGGCLKGSRCEFRHDISFDSVAPAEKDYSKTPRAYALPSADDFPALPAGNVHTKAPRGPPQTGFLFPSNAFAGRTKTETHAGPGARSGAAAEPRHAKRPVKVDDRDLSWRATGANVERLYLEARKHAFQQAAIRNRYFQLAAELYRRGAGAAAAEMARRGRELNEVVQTLHGEAAEEILQQRNSGGSLMELDLHGLHPQEAVNALQSHLNMLADRRATGTLKIIIGSGNHSARGLQLAKPVEGFLATQGYRYSLGTMKDGRGGIILVTV